LNVGVVADFYDFPVQQLVAGNGVVHVIQGQCVNPAVVGAGIVSTVQRSALDVVAVTLDIQLVGAVTHFNELAALNLGVPGIPVHHVVAVSGIHVFEGTAVQVDFVITDSAGNGVFTLHICTIQVDDVVTGTAVYAALDDRHFVGI